MAEKSTFPANSIVICSKKEFGKNSVADTHQNRTVWPRERTGRLSMQQGYAGGEEHAQILLGGGGLNDRLHPKLDRR